MMASRILVGDTMPEMCDELVVLRGVALEIEGDRRAVAFGDDGVAGDTEVRLIAGTLAACCDQLQ